MSSIDIYTQYPLEMDPSTKAITLPETSATQPNQNRTIANELQLLNNLHRGLVNLGSPNTPPPPLPVNPKRSAQITKLRDSANTAYRKSNHGEAARLYSYAIEMAVTRPGWEPIVLVREESASLFANRAQAYMAQQAWAEALVDARCSVDCKASGNVKAYWRGGKCMLEMGRLEEAKEFLGKGLDIEGRDGEGGKELLGLLEEIEKSSRR